MITPTCLSMEWVDGPSSEFKSQKKKQFYKLDLCWLMLILLGVKTIEIRGKKHEEGVIVGLCANGWTGILWGEAKIHKVQELTGKDYVSLKNKHRIDDERSKYRKPHALYLSDVKAYTRRWYFTENHGTQGNPGNMCL